MHTAAALARLTDFCSAASGRQGTLVTGSPHVLTGMSQVLCVHADRDDERVQLKVLQAVSALLDAKSYPLDVESLSKVGSQ